MNIIWALYILSYVRAGYSEHKRSKQASGQKVLLISLDGFRWDFMSENKNKIPNMIQMEQQGVRANYLLNVFPTNTFSNHYSVVTGLYPENHGIIDNQMYDIKKKEKFSMKSTNAKWWNKAEPIWITNQVNGHKSGLCYWPGFNVKIKGKLPTYAPKMDKYANPLIDFQSKHMPSTERIDLALNWLSEPAVTFAAIYFEDFDSQLHDSGTEISDKTFADIDNTFAYLKKKLNRLALEQKVNVIVVGDHGGKDVNHNKIIRLKDYIDIKKHVEMALGKTFVSMFPKPGQLQSVYNQLVHVHPNMTVYRKWELPTYMHIKHSKLTAPLLLLADPGWIIETGFETGVYFQGNEFYKGEHGYDVFHRDMNPGFFAFGPCFKKKKTIKKMKTIDLYPIMCKIIGITPRKNDASVKPMKELLTKHCL